MECQPVIDLLSHQKRYKDRFFFTEFVDCPFITTWSKIDLASVNTLPGLSDEEEDLVRLCLEDGVKINAGDLQRDDFLRKHRLMLAPKLNPMVMVRVAKQRKPTGETKKPASMEKEEKKVAKGVVEKQITILATTRAQEEAMVKSAEKTPMVDLFKVSVGTLLIFDLVADVSPMLNVSDFPSESSRPNKGKGKVGEGSGPEPMLPQ